MDQYKFTNSWFDQTTKETWDLLLPDLKPKKILEIGSFEGRSICYLIENLSLEPGLEIHCIDTWAGGINVSSAEMSAAEDRFDKNIELAQSKAVHPVVIKKHKGYSDFVLCQMIAGYSRSQFDFIYVDGSHLASDVLCDAVLAFRLLKVGGVLAFDDYQWIEDAPSSKDLLRCPKPAIDAFTNLYFKKISMIPTSALQQYMIKTAEVE